jgi:cytochrome c oxidase subunit 1
VLTGSKTFAWLASVWARPTRARVPMFWLLGLLFVAVVTTWFSIGDVSRLMLSDARIDRALHDTYYVVAHFHYLLALAVVFAFFAAWYYVFPKVAGCMYSEPLAQLHFWLTFIGVNVLIWPQLLLLTAPRRVVGYTDAFAALNWWSSVGSAITAAGTLVFAAGVLYAFFVVRGRHG